MEIPECPCQVELWWKVYKTTQLKRHLSRSKCGHWNGLVTEYYKTLLITSKWILLLHKGHNYFWFTATWKKKSSSRSFPILPSVSVVTTDFTQRRATAACVDGSESKGRWFSAVWGGFKEVYIVCKSPLQHSLNVYKSDVLYLAFTLEWITLHGVTRRGFADENVSLDLILRGEKLMRQCTEMKSLLLYL